MNEGATCCSHRGIRLREYGYGGQAESRGQSNKKAIFRDFRLPTVVVFAKAGVFRGQKNELINKEPGS